jgi:hypothetical protein
LELKNILSFTRDNATNNDKFLSTILLKNPTIKPIYDIRCISHILNIVVRDILKEYLLQLAAEIELSNYTNTITNINTINNNIINKGITNKCRRIATLIKYTFENKTLFLEGIEKYKKDN